MKCKFGKDDIWKIQESTLSSKPYCLKEWKGGEKEGKLETWGWHEGWFICFRKQKQKQKKKKPRVLKQNK